MKMDKVSSRPIRNRKQNRRSWSPADIQRPTVKRLFTPDIKRMLKDWLIRRRENPYPSRDEKKSLAYETGLTYTQICNWFANWRRKLKNSGKEPAKKSWGNLIKNYNTSARGNVEQFSISSADSIWEEENKNQNYDNQTSEDEYTNCSSCDDINTNNINNNGKIIKIHNKNEYNFLISNLVNKSSNSNGKYSDPYDDTNLRLNDDKFISGITKYKHQMIEKYYTDSNNRINENYSVNFLDSPRTSSSTTASTASSPELSKWLESTANFQPNKKNYIEWNRDKLTRNNDKNQLNSSDENLSLDTFHQKEIEAAEALANLWNESRQRFNQNNTNNNSINSEISTCS